MGELWLPENIRARKIVRWAVACLAATWLPLKVADLLADNLGTPASGRAEA